MNDKQLDALHQVLEHFIRDERFHFWEGDYQLDSGHIYLALAKLEEYYNEQAKNKESKEERRTDWHDQGDGDFTYTNTPFISPSVIEKARS